VCAGGEVSSFQVYTCFWLISQEKRKGIGNGGKNNEDEEVELRKKMRVRGKPKEEVIEKNRNERKRPLSKKVLRSRYLNR